MRELCVAFVRRFGYNTGRLCRKGCNGLIKKWSTCIYLLMPLVAGLLHGLLIDHLASGTWWFVPYYLVPIALAALWFNVGTRFAGEGVKLPAACLLAHALGIVSIVAAAGLSLADSFQHTNTLFYATQLFTRAFGVFSGRIALLFFPSGAQAASAMQVVLAVQCVALVEMALLFVLGYQAKARAMRKAQAAQTPAEAPAAQAE